MISCSVFTLDEEACGAGLGSFLTRISEAVALGKIIASHGAGVQAYLRPGMIDRWFPDPFLPSKTRPVTLNLGGVQRVFLSQGFR